MNKFEKNVDTLKEAVAKLKEIEVPTPHGLHNLLLVGAINKSEKPGDMTVAFFATGTEEGFVTSLTLMAEKDLSLANAIKVAATIIAVKENPIIGAQVAQLLVPDAHEECDCENCQKKRAKAKNKIANNPDIN